ncbi:hypothetical protein NIA69_05685 [Gemmiger formicilis]|nr:hypothetical protein [Gemmiger formicilis]
MAAVLWCVPFFFTNYNHTIYLTTTYMTSYGDVPAGLVFGGAVAAWLALRQNSAPSGPCCRFWRCLPTSRPIRLYWRWWRRGWWLWTSGCLPTTAISRPVCSPHRVQPCLLCRADGNLLSVECALCRLARQPQRQ